MRDHRSRRDAKGTGGGSRAGARGRSPVSATAATYARVAYIGLLLLATLVPFRLDLDISAVLERLAGALQPAMSARDVVDGVRNLVLFAGWGALWVTTARTLSDKKALISAVVSGGLLSLAIETCQLFSAARTASVLDLMTNTFGALIGAGAIVVLTATASWARGRRSYVGVPAFLFAGSYLLAVSLEALIPLFRQDALPGVFGGPIARSRAAFANFEAASIFDLPLGDFLLFLPAGAFLVAALAEAGVPYRAVAWIATLAGCGLAVVAELGHAPMGLRVELGPIVVHCVAISAGAWVARFGLPALSRRLHGAERPRALLTVYALIVGLWSFRPYVPETDLQLITEQLSLSRLVPLQAHAPRVDLFSVSDVMASAFLYLPLGLLLAVWPLRLRGPLRGFLPAIYLAVIAEVGQLFVSGRFFDVTDVLVAAAAAAIGWVVVRRAGFKPYGEVLGSSMS